MQNNIIKFPYAASRRLHSRKPRRSKNGTPEERAAKAPKAISATIIELPEPEEPTVDRRKLRGNPLRDKVGPISFAVTIVGKMHTADLRGEPLPEDAGGWLEELRVGAAAARLVADELDKAFVRLAQVQRTTEVTERVMLKYGALSPEQQQIVFEEVNRTIKHRQESEISHFPLNLPVPDLGQPVLSLAAEHDQ